VADVIKVLGISGSLRRASFNTGLLRAAAAVLPPEMEMSTFPLHDLPLFNADVEELGIPEPVVALRSAIEGADGLLFATPEYNYSITGVLKNAFDWASRGPSPLDGKPAAIMGVGGRQGTVRAQMHMRQIALHNSMRVMIDPEVFVAGAWSAFDDQGRLTDERLRERVRQLMTAFGEFVRYVPGDPTLRWA